MISSILGTPLTGQFFSPILILMIIIFIALRIKGRFQNNLKEENQAAQIEDKTESNEDAPSKEVKKVKKVKLKKNCCKDEKSDINTSISEIKIYYGSDGKSKV